MYSRGMSEAAPRSRTETRHHPLGRTCHHFQYHRLTCDEYDSLRARAAGRCELCGIAEEEAGGKRLVVDHFELGSARFIRGVLCDKCNAVMSCLDGTKTWGQNRSWEARALAYEANAWHQPPPEQWQRIRAIRDCGGRLR
jgi:hypothetical protein